MQANIYALRSSNYIYLTLSFDISWTMNTTRHHTHKPYRYTTLDMLLATYMHKLCLGYTYGDWAHGAHGGVTVFFVAMVRNALRRCCWQLVDVGVKWGHMEIVFAFILQSAAANKRAWFTYSFETARMITCIDVVREPQLQILHGISKTTLDMAMYYI